MNIMLIGSDGMLGQELRQLLSQTNHITRYYDREELDITHPQWVEAVVGTQQPDVIINCAAYTDVDNSEAAPALAFRVNALGPEYLAKSSARYGGRLIHISTDYVFNGQKESPYLEIDLTGPTNVYGHSKLAGENAVLAHNPNSLILRTAWLYGQHGKNFVTTMLKLGQTRSSVSVVADQFGAPTWTYDLASVIIGLLDSDATGIYHASANGQTSWYQLTREIFQLANIRAAVEPIRSDELIRLATRPQWSVLDKSKLKSLGHEFPYYKHSLELFLKQMLSQIYFDRVAS
jgi:dTDP-4-dehydrorhamnose reductase